MQVRGVHLVSVRLASSVLSTLSSEEQTSSFTHNQKTDHLLLDWRSDSSNLTYLDYFVPSGRDDDGVGRVRGESHTRNPLTVSFLLNREFAVTKSVPQLDGPVTRTRNNLPVVGRERNGQDISIVSYESLCRVSSVEVP